MNFATDFEEMFRTAAKEAGHQITVDIQEVREYAAARALHLSTIIGQKGYQKALVAERDNVALKAGVKTVIDADAADQRLTGLIMGALGAGARALAGGV